MEKEHAVWNCQAFPTRQETLPSILLFCYWNIWHLGISEFFTRKRSGIGGALTQTPRASSCKSHSHKFQTTTCHSASELSKTNVSPVCSQAWSALPYSFLPVYFFLTIMFSELIATFVLAQYSVMVLAAVRCSGLLRGQPRPPTHAPPSQTAFEGFGWLFLPHWHR